MIHFEQSTSMYYPRARSVSRYSVEPFFDGPRYRTLSVEPRYSTTTSTIGTHPVTMIGSRYKHYAPSSTYYNSYHYPRSHVYGSSLYDDDYPKYRSGYASDYRYLPYVNSRYTNYYTPYVRSLGNTWYDNTLPTSHLHATKTSWVHSIFLISRPCYRRSLFSSVWIVLIEALRNLFNPQSFIISEPRTICGVPAY